MASPRITLEAVYSAADALVEQGDNPTVAAVRDSLGSGSFSTITKFLHDWRENKERSSVSVDLPEKVEAAYRSAAAAAWNESQRMAAEQVSVIRDQMEQERVRFSSELKESCSEIERLEGAVSDLESNLKLLQSSFSSLQRDLIVVESDRDHALRRGDSLALKVEALESEHKVLLKQVGALEAKASRRKPLSKKNA